MAMRDNISKGVKGNGAYEKGDLLSFIITRKSKTRTYDFVHAIDY